MQRVAKFTKYTVRNKKLKKMQPIYVVWRIKKFISNIMPNATCKKNNSKNIDSLCDKQMN